MDGTATPARSGITKLKFTFNQEGSPSVTTQEDDTARTRRTSVFLGKIFEGEADPTLATTHAPESAAQHHSTPMTRASSRSTRQTSQSVEPAVTTRRATRNSLGEGVDALNGNSVEDTAAAMSAQIGAKGRGGKKAKAKIDDSEDEDYQGSEGDDDEGMDLDAEGEDEDDYNDQSPPPKPRRPTRNQPKSDDDADFIVQEEDAPVKKERFVPKRRGAPKLADSEEDEDDARDEKPVLVETRTRSGRTTTRPAEYPSDDSQAEEREQKRKKLRRGSDRKEDDYADPVEEGSTYEDSDGNVKHRRKQRERRNSGDYNSDQHTTSDTGSDLDLNDDDSAADEMVMAARMNAPRALRAKNKVDYYRPLNIDPVDGSSKKRRKSGHGHGMFNGLPSKMTGEQYAALYPGQQPDSDSSDDDVPNFGAGGRKGGAFGGAFPAGGGGMLSGGAALGAAGGGPSNFGKVKNATALADADPLGVPSDISFDSVGGMGSHIQQLKEMVSLPLLYPEVFERFKITPPRGVLFHGPPGTGKTLLARALAASCSTDGRKISFFMRKGADCLSKWVGEAERQLRLLFEEAKACQPSIIFFDEIDGLAPVRSAKQDQIHASIVSTMLALMDGMDGRGQVIIIGATNRPDAIDPALRRPGRFDREFYFPLPNLEARRKILDIHTGGWNPPLDPKFKDELAELTKGYGGADLRALCTEAALNAVQRTYPQIYKTNDKLLIKPESIGATARDFTLAQKNLIPSTARSTSSSAAPLPPQLEPLLSASLEEAKAALKRVLPEVKKVNVLEEAEWEDDNAGFEKEKMLAAFQQLRVFRPRMLIAGEEGMGQSYIGAAVLQHLEGFHVQALDLATLVSDSSRGMEASCVQLFVEAKRHKPSILFIPSLITWSHSVSETVRATIKGLLDGLDPSDPILLLAIVDGPLSELPGDVRSWFGFVKGNRVIMKKSTAEQRELFFADVMAGIARPPNEFPDALPRRKRILEELPIAPPPPPRQPTEAELQRQNELDGAALDLLKYHLNALVGELKRKFRRFCRALYKDWVNDDRERRENQLSSGQAVVGFGHQPYLNVDLETVGVDLYKGAYLTPAEFLDDILRIQSNAQINSMLEGDKEAEQRAAQMVNHVKVMLSTNFNAEQLAEFDHIKERAEKREEGLTEAEKAKLAKTRRKRRVPVDLDPGAVRKRAVHGGFRIIHPELCSAEEKTEEYAPPVVEAEGVEAASAAAVNGGTKRPAEESGVGEGAAAPNGDEHGPSKRARQDDLTMADGTALAPAPVDPTTLGPVANGASASLPLALDASPFSSLGPDAAAAAALGAAGGAVNVGDGMLAAPPLTAVPGVPISLSPNSIVPSTVPSTTPVPPSVLTAATAPTSPAPSAVDPPAPTPAPAPPREPTPAPEPHPDFVLPTAEVAQLKAFLVQETADLTVDQLEQMRAAAYDLIWTGRASWDRGGLVAEIGEMAREFVEEVREVNGGMEM